MHYECFASLDGINGIYIPKNVNILYMCHLIPSSQQLPVTFNTIMWTEMPFKTTMLISNAGSDITLCIRETPKMVLFQTVKT